MTAFTPSHYRRRLIGLAVVLTTGYVALAGWLGYWQLARQEEYARLAGQNWVKRQPVPAARGLIMDVNGTVLAASRPVKTVCVDPSLAVLPPELDYCRKQASQIIARELELPYQKVLRITQPRWFRNAKGEWVLDHFELLQREVPWDRWSRLTNALAHLDFGLDESELVYTNRSMLRALRTRMVYARDDFQRYYPGGRLACHVVGFVTKKEIHAGDDVVGEMYGRGGIEQSLNRVLQGTPGWRRGREVCEPRPGFNVVLTLDAGVQSIVEQELRAAVREWNAPAAFAVAIRPRTGDILAMASYPDFDPAHRTDMKALQNWVISSAPDPGSTMKLITYAAGLEDHCFRWDEIIDCELGPWKPPCGGQPIRDAAGHYLGKVPIRVALVKSSNIGAAKLAYYRIPPSRFIEVYRAFGLDSRTGVPLPNEAARPIKNPPKPVDYIHMAFGYVLNPTPFQMAMAYAALANDGLLMHPRLIERITDADGQTVIAYPPAVWRRAISPRTARSLTEVLQAVPTPEGTAPKAALDLYRVAGKTGTASIYNPATGNYVGAGNYASFVGFFPATRPEVCLFVGIMKPRHGRWGGTVAGPAWRNMAEQIASYLRIRPDKQEAPDWLPGDLPAGLSPLAAGQRLNAPLRNYW